MAPSEDDLKKMDTTPTDFGARDKARREFESARDEVQAAQAARMRGSEPPDFLMQFFVFEHLPPELQEISKPFCALAVGIVANVPRNPERTVALRKLLEAKDCAVRAAVAR